MGLRAGSLDRSVALLRRGPAIDNGVELVPGEWRLLGMRRASVKPVARREGREGEGRSAPREISLWMRFDALTRTLTARDALAFEGRLLELVAEPLEIGRRQGVEVIAAAAEPAVSIDAASLPSWAG